MNSDFNKTADVAQLVEHILGKDEVTGSIPVVSSKKFYRSRQWQKVILDK